jgi:hypothetical protein
VAYVTHPRKFLLSHALVLVAATAVGFFVARPYYAVTTVDWTPPMPSASSFAGWVGGIWDCLVMVSPIVMAWTLAILALEFWPPRPRWRELVRQPGFVAGMTAAFVLLVRLCGFATMYARVFGREKLWIMSVPRTGGGGALPGWPPRNLLFETDHFLSTAALIGVSVAANWIVLRASGAWRSERGWIDRVGLVLGWFWIAILPLSAWWDFHMRF